MKKLWTFGCSFTDADAFTSIRSYSWPVLLSENLGIKLNDYGQSGESSQGIIWRLVEQLPNIQEGDFVSVGLSHPERISVPDYVRNNLVIRSISRCTAVPDGNMFEWGVTHLGEQGLETAVNYINRVVYSNLNSYEKLYMDQAFNILTLLEERGVKTILWDFNIWYLFEKFKDWSSSLDDGHWSPNGHFEVFLFFKYCFDYKIKKADYKEFKKYSKHRERENHIKFKEEKFKELVEEIKRHG